jgi:hypothetical protein
MILVVCLARLSGDVHHSLSHTCDILYDILCDLSKPHGARGTLCWENLALQADPFAAESIAKHDILL